MIIKYSYGAPLETNATVKKIKATQKPLPFLQKEGSSFLYTMDEDSVVYGLGQSMRGINKRGWIYESFNTDVPLHTEDTRSLYGSHNFLLVDAEQTFALFVDSPAKVTFDIGYTQLDELSITLHQPDFDLYIITGTDKKDIVKQFRQLIGKSYIPPLWAFGYQQSRWSYKTADEVREVVRQHRESGVPLDAVYLDIDYMESFKDFTVNEEAFPSFAEFVQEMKAQNIHLVPIIDAGVKIEKGYSVYDEGIKGDHFCKDAEGNNFEAAVWPGLTHFPDFFKEDTRKWFGSKYKYLTDMGIDGFWNDMNEPAIFYTKKKLEAAWKKLESYKDKELDVHNFFEVRDIFKGLDDYEEFYHEINGKSVRHDKVHNLYGFNMTKSAAAALAEIEPQKRMLLFSRASYVGMHRYSGIWTGDNMSWWSHILQCLKQLPGLSMCGFLYAGSDIGGFGTNTTEDLLLRWLAFSVFTPLMRNHSAMGTREQEFYRFSNTEAFKQIITVRYQLLPYLYSEYLKAALNDEMLFKPLSFDYPEDAFAAQVEDQLMVGESIMMAPVYEQNARGRHVYLPENMLMVKCKGEKKSCKRVQKGYIYVRMPLDEVVFFIKENTVVPMSFPVEHTAQLNHQKLILVGLVTDQAKYALYTDDGVSNPCLPLKTNIGVLASPDQLMVTTENPLLELVPEIYGGRPVG